MRLKLLITNIVFFALLLSAMVVMSIKAPQYFNRLSHYLKNPHYTAPKNDSRYGGTLVWGTVNPPTIINPVLTSHSVSASIIPLLFDGLVRINSKGEIEPGLVKSWTVSQDGLVYTFYLKEKVYFHDGQECTADDVKFTYDQIKQSPISIYRSDFLLVDHFEAPDRHTFIVILKKPYPDLPYEMVRYIIPAHAFSKKSLTSTDFNDHPVGTGPFRFVSWDSSSNEITLAANENYFEGRPFLDKIVIKVYKDNTSLWAALMRGEVDFVKFLNQKDYEVLTKDPTFKTYQFPTGLYFAIIYNLQDSVLNSRELRHALSYAVDRKALMRAVGIGGIESNGPFYPQSPWVDKEAESVTYDPLRAIKMLNRLGWGDGDRTGILKKENKPLALTMLVDRNSWYYCQMAIVLRQQLSEIGVGLKVVFYDNENQLIKDSLGREKPQMWLRMFLGSDSNPSNMVRSWYSYSSEFDHVWNYKNKKVDQLFEQSLSIKEKRQSEKIYQKIFTLVEEDQPACFLFFPYVYSVVSSKVGNTEGFFNDYMPDYLIKQWFIADERR